MKSFTLASISALAAPFGVAAAEPSEERSGAYRCRVESIRNVSTAQNLSVAEPELVFAPGRLGRQGEGLVLEEVLVDPHSESIVLHRIDLASGRYSATAMRTDHAMGEQYEIEASGWCELLVAGEGEQ